MSADKLEVGDIRKAGARRVYIVVKDYSVDSHKPTLKRLWMNTDMQGPLGIGGVTEPSLADKYICNVADSFIEMEKMFNELPSI